MSVNSAYRSLHRSVLSLLLVVVILSGCAGAIPPTIPVKEENRLITLQTLTLPETQILSFDK